MDMILKSSKQSGFTLVEMALAMIVIGLLIGIVVAGGKIRDNAQAVDIVKSITLYESSIIKFRELYGELPGDIRDPSSKLTNCNAVPCSRGGDGDGIIDPDNSTTFWVGPITNTDESFVFWNHLLSAGLITGFKGTDSVVAGEGVPALDPRGGFALYHSGSSRFRWPYDVGRPYHAFLLSTIINSTGNHGGTAVAKCPVIEKADKKMDDGLAVWGRFQAGQGGCHTLTAANSVYDIPNGEATIRYATKF